MSEKLNAIAKWMIRRAASMLNRAHIVTADGSITIPSDRCVVHMEVIGGGGAGGSPLSQGPSMGSNGKIKDDNICAGGGGGTGIVIDDSARIDFMEHFGVDWDGMSAYFHMAGSHSGDNLRHCIDRAIVATRWTGKK